MVSMSLSDYHDIITYIDGLWYVMYQFIEDIIEDHACYICFKI